MPHDVRFLFLPREETEGEEKGKGKGCKYDKDSMRVQGKEASNFSLVDRTIT